MKVAAESTTAVVLVFVHGNNGGAKDWDPTREAIQRLTWLGKSERVFSFASSVSEGSRTLAGVEVLAQRFVEELADFVEKSVLPRHSKWALYVVSHSLGGLVTRCAVPAILARFANSVIPFGYLSIASPHLGVRRPGGDVLKNTWKFLTESACEKYYNQTGQDLMLIAKDGKGVEESILVKMADPKLPYLQGLGKFALRTVVSAPFLDMLVPYSTSAISPFHPYEEDDKRPDDGRCCVFGYSGFSSESEKVLSAFARSDAKNKPLDEAKGFVKELPEDPDHFECDRHRFVKWHPAAMANLRSLAFRRLDVALAVSSRFQIHDSFLKKKLRGVLPHSGQSGDDFIFMLAHLIAVDLESFRGEDHAVE